MKNPEQKTSGFFLQIQNVGMFSIKDHFFMLGAEAVGKRPVTKSRVYSL